MSLWPNHLDDRAAMLHNFMQPQKQLVNHRYHLRDRKILRPDTCYLLARTLGFVGSSFIGQIALAPIAMTTAATVSGKPRQRAWKPKARSGCKTCK
ncbi:sequence-specific DNA binding RNA polymerase II transcription factor [Alternaria alternata]|jgi:hypothetical protein|nr:sequence-specific DNA binding RNA polymerase II transcription factor [Alternaria alternata]